MPRRKKLYEGKAKIIFQGPKPGTIVQYFKDDATAYNNKKKGSIVGKGVINNLISEYLMNKIAGIGIKTHFLRRLNLREQLVKKVEIIPVEVVVRNIAAGSISKRFAIEEGSKLPRSMVEYYYKDDNLGDPLISEEHITGFGWANIYEIEEILNTSLIINDFLIDLFLEVGLKLVDFKIEFGRLCLGNKTEIILADEFSPDNCRLWDSKTNKKMDKDRFRRDLGNVESAYQEVAKRLGISLEKRSLPWLNLIFKWFFDDL